MNKQLEDISKFLSYVLRHKPDAIGLTLDDGGWANVRELVACASLDGRLLTAELVCATVEYDHKQRYSLNANQTRIRANQGHSIAVNLDLVPKIPPAVLYHGTASRFEASIRENGLTAATRQYVHLTHDEATAVTVGKRHGQPVILKIDTTAMLAAGHEFYLSENNVWLCKTVPVKFLVFPDLH